jgi:hypothetical protein
MRDKGPKMPDGFPLDPIDRAGDLLRVGDEVTVLAVESCARNLPVDDQRHLQSIVGARRRIEALDPYGFVWLSFTSDDPKADFCLLPREVCKRPP